MKIFSQLMAATAFAVVVPMSASAVTISGGDEFDSGSSLLTAGGSLTFTFDAADDLSFPGIVVGGTDSGPDAQDNLSMVTFGFVSPTTTVFSSFTDESPAGASASGQLPGMNVAAGSGFSVIFESDAPEDVSVTFNFETEQGFQNVVPVPAAGILLATALGGAGFVARRKKKSA